jgi:hypothetical protein
VHKGIELVVPWHVAFAEAEKFLHQQRKWIISRTKKYQQLRDAMPKRQLITGETLPLHDHELQLLVHIEPERKRTHVLAEADQLQVHVSEQAQVRAAVERWYKREAKLYFTTITTDLSACVGQSVSKISIGSHRSQWGSCNRAGRLSFTWRLMLAPEWIAHYVAAHEVAHLTYGNHSKQYWAVVRGLDSRTQEARAWLRRHGHTVVL